MSSLAKIEITIIYNIHKYAKMKIKGIWSWSYKYLRIKVLIDRIMIFFMINQHETHVTTNTFKRCLSNFLHSSRRQENAENKRINLSTVSNNLESIFTWMTSPEIATVFDSRAPACVLPFKTNTEITHTEAMKPLIKCVELLDPASRSKCYKTLPSILTSSGFVRDDSTVTKTDKAYRDDGASKIIFTLRENRQSRIDRTTEQASTGDLSTCIAAKNADSPSPTKPETPELQRRRSRDSFETLQQLNIMKTQECTRGKNRLHSIFSNTAGEISQI